MSAFILRRLFQAVLTVFGIMLLTFILFNLMAGDIAAAHKGTKVPEDVREKWRVEHGLRDPLFVNWDKAPWIWQGTQFYRHLKYCVTFSGTSWKAGSEGRTVIDEIKEKGKYSLAITVPVMAMGWIFGLSVAAIVAFYRGRLIDKMGVFVSVLGLCIPYLAYIILGQWLMFHASPEHAFGLSNPINVYVPVLIAVAASLGGDVRFYRTIILDQVSQDYVRTARAKGVSTPVILGKHVLKNCMLPILTSLIMSIPFLILGSFLLERFFGINGLGGLMIRSIAARDVPFITGLTFLTALVYVVMLLVTDVLYAVFDPRIRLK